MYILPLEFQGMSRIYDYHNKVLKYSELKAYLITLLYKSYQFYGWIIH